MLVQPTKYGNDTRKDAHEGTTKRIAQKNCLERQDAAQYSVGYRILESTDATIYKEPVAAMAAYWDFPYNRIREAGFRCYSQFEEDGIILYLLTMIGVDAGTVAEMCCGNGMECMATNLILNHGYKGYLFDGDEANIKAATQFFNKKKDCLLVKPELKHTWITTENVNALLTNSGCPKDVDFFSLDIDGNDYWIWEAIDAINPKSAVLRRITWSQATKVSRFHTIQLLTAGHSHLNFKIFVPLALQR